MYYETTVPAIQNFAGNLDCTWVWTGPTAKTIEKEKASVAMFCKQEWTLRSAKNDLEMRSTMTYHIFTYHITYQVAHLVADV